eukprot:CAMPEP_0116871054 /NCGR_PEP_ID=MMETSP0463-20121206/1244_1 /TAXON_ID=181622 /ORGANISM="Strombidinopsis sp, Strain SopsisLIS2011" /LENGTH=110 /DNA_ID=CAMNT_0004508771 /DNA_START=162 /DNA_END=494 /DNA_ORIENTATION=-
MDSEIGDIIDQNKYGDTFLHVAIKHSSEKFVCDIINVMKKEKMLNIISTLDIVNKTEKMTPYMLAAVRKYDQAQAALLATGKVDKNFKNSNGHTAEEIVKIVDQKKKDYE